MEKQIKWKFEGSGNWFSTEENKLESAIQKERNRANIGSNIKIIYENVNTDSNQDANDSIEHDTNINSNRTSSKSTPIPMVIKKGKIGKETL